MNISPKQLEAVIALPGPKRYEHFIKVAADRSSVWGLHAAGWALAATCDGQQVFPLWHAREYAEACARGDWEAFVPEQIDLDTLFEVLIPKLREAGNGVAVFPTPADRGVVPHLAQLVDDLRADLARFG